MKGEPKLQHLGGDGGWEWGAANGEEASVQLSLRPSLLLPHHPGLEPPLTLFPVLRSLKISFRLSAPPDPKTKPATERGRQVGREEGRRGSAVWVEERVLSTHAPSRNKPPLAWHLWVLPCLENAKEVDGLEGELGGGAVRRGGVGREERGGGRGAEAGRLSLRGKGARPPQPRGLQRIANCN